MSQFKVNQTASVSVSALLSLLLPGTGQYYAGRSLKESLGWYVLSYLIALIADLALLGSETPVYVSAGLLIITIHFVAMIHASYVAQRTRMPQRDSRRFPALSVVLPGLGQIKTGRYLRGIAWLFGFAVFISLQIILGTNEPDPQVDRGLLFVSLGIYNLLSGYDMHKILERSDQ